MDDKGNEYFTFAQVVDAGPFGNNCVMQPDGFCASIVADFPAGIWPHGSDISASVVYIQYITEAARKQRH